MGIADKYKESRLRTVELAGVTFHLRQPDVRRILIKHELTSAEHQALKAIEVTGADDMAVAMARHDDLVDLTRAVLDDCCDELTLDPDQVSDDVMLVDDLGKHDMLVLGEEAYTLWGMTLQDMAVIAPFPDEGSATEAGECDEHASEPAD